MAPVRWATPATAVICTVAQAVGNVYEWDHHIHRVPEAMQGVVGTPAAEDEPAPVTPLLKGADEEIGDPGQETVPRSGVVDDVNSVERRAQDSRVCDFATIAAADAAFVDGGHRVIAQRVVQRLHGKRRAA